MCEKQPHAIAQTGWIPVTECKPASGEFVWISVNSKTSELGRWYGGSMWLDKHEWICLVTHWRPLEAPPPPDKN